MFNKDEHENVEVGIWRKPPLPTWDGDLEAEQLLLLLSRKNLHQMACMLVWWNMEPREISENILEEVYERHTGEIIDMYGNPIDKLRFDPMDHASEDMDRDIRDFMRFADEPPKRRGWKSLQWRYLLIAMAIEIDLRRHIYM